MLFIIFEIRKVFNRYQEEAFALFTTIMHEYDFRSLYLHSFTELRLRFWILEQLVESTLPSLHAHFKDLGVEAHMFSSQEMIKIVFFFS